MNCQRCNGSGTEPDNLAIGSEFRGRRAASGIGLRSAAKSLKISAGYLSNLETGQRRWTPLLMDKYLDLLRNPRIHPRKFRA